MLSAVLFLLAVASVASAQDCFEFTGAVAEEGFGAELGSTIELTWVTKDTEECKSVTPNSQVLIELWDEDTFFDDKLAVLSSSGEGNEGVSNSGSFSWSVPFETTELNKLAGSTSFFGGKTQLYFKIVAQLNSDIKSKSQTFVINEAGASIAVPALDASKYVTGSSFSFTVKTIKLPSRLIKCYVRDRAIVNLDLLTNSVLVAEFTTENNGNLQEQTFEWRVASTLNSDPHMILCETADDKEPAAKFASPPDRDFDVVKQDLDLAVTAPTETDVITANTEVVVKWTYTSGIAPTEKIRVDLFSQSVYLGFDRSIATTGDDGAVSPDAGTVSLLVPPGAVGVYYIVLTVVGNRAIRVTSDRFAIKEATKGCTLIAPLSSAPLVAGQEVTVKYRCVGFTEDATAKAELVNTNDYNTAGGEAHLLEAAAPLKEGVDHEITYDLTQNVQPGWAWHLRLTVGDNSMSSRPFLVVNAAAEHCAAAGNAIKCDPAAAKPNVAVTTGHDLELQNFEMDFNGVVCGSKFASFKVKSNVRLRGVSQAFSQSVSVYAGQPRVGFPMFGEAGDNVANEFILLISDVVYPETRDSIKFDIELQQSPDLATLPIGTVELAGLGGLPAECTKAVDDEDSRNQEVAEEYTKPPTVATRGVGAATTVAAATTTAPGDTTAPGPGGTDPDSASAVSLAVGAVLAAVAMLA
eukprot:TRINITY_DN838_c0_g1_i2.p2 TRINITY_DN838_c0_g1~~TRINITY_DN838_c0_g1_i2.p2  ORF type:complete len:706 (-),score=405.51 TRINITY_DN838_c0_g1_i2:64-2139(-)